MSLSSIPFYANRLAAKLELSQKWKLDPGLWDLIPWRSCTIRILIVADDFLYFSDEDFGLSDLIAFLHTEPFAFARFEITAAHRNAVSDARAGVGNPHIKRAIKSFRFDNADHFSTGTYDQVWLFGAGRSRKNGDSWSGKLPDAEIRVLSQFMDQGGGVFATGDHEDLGAALCGFVPRVRAMRQWFFPVAGPHGEPLAPPFDGPGRNDTNRVGHDPNVQFDDQSDDVPQHIEPTWYTARTGFLREAVWPHPVLCGPNGPIRVLPDHPHESACIVPGDLSVVFQIDGYAVTEFPAGQNGNNRPVPEVIATSEVQGGHTTSGKSGTTVSRTFGAIGAYDGHRAGVGRIVVDSTWHHFLNINLTGEAGATSPKNVGFLATTQGQAVLDEIRAYFLNIALWISPPAKILCMRNWAILTVINSHRLHEVFDPAVTLKTARLIDFILIGRHARDALGKYASRCQSYRWTIDLVRLRLERPWYWIDPIDPWAPKLQTIDDKESPAWMDIDWVHDAAMGGAILAAREAFFPLAEDKVKRLADDLSPEIERGATAGIDAAVRQLHADTRQLIDAGIRLTGNHLATNFIDSNGGKMESGDTMTFEEVNAHVEQADLRAIESNLKSAIGPTAAIGRVCEIYKVARPILMLLKGFPLPAKWKQVIEQFVSVMDTICPG